MNASTVGTPPREADWYNDFLKRQQQAANEVAQAVSQQSAKTAESNKQAADQVVQSVSEESAKVAESLKHASASVTWGALAGERKALTQMLVQLSSFGAKVEAASFAQEVQSLEKLAAGNKHDDAVNGFRLIQPRVAELHGLYPARGDWAKLAEEVRKTEEAITNLTGKAPEAGGWKKTLDGLKQMATDQAKQYGPAVAGFPALKKSVEEIAALYPARGDWAKLGTRVGKAEDAIASMANYKAPEAAGLKSELETLKGKATDQKKEYGPAVTDFPNLEKKVLELFALYPGRGRWATEVVPVLAQTRDRIAKLKEWGADVTEFENMLAEAERNATDEAGKYADAVFTFKLLTEDREGVDAMHKYWDTFRVLVPEYDKHMKTQPDNASELRATMESATNQAEAKNFDAAAKTLNRLKKMMNEGQVRVADPGQLKERLASQRTTAAGALGQLATKSRGLGTTQAGEAADILNELANNFPTELETKLESLAAAIKEKNKENQTKFKGESRTAVQQWLKFLQSHAAYVAASEKNPLGVAVAIDAPIKATLTAILKQTTA